MRTVEEIIKLLIAHFGFKTEYEVAKLLSVEANTISGWKKRGKIPYENLHKIALQHNLSLDELLGIDAQIHINSDEKELLSNFKKLSNEKKEIYKLRIKADSLEGL